MPKTNKNIVFKINGNFSEVEILSDNVSNNGIKVISQPEYPKNDTRIYFKDWSRDFKSVNEAVLFRERIKQNVDMAVKSGLPIVTIMSEL